MAEVATLAAANTRFAFTLFHLQANKTTGNIFTSPISISFALAMTYLGARNNTKSQMSQVLHFNEVEEAELHKAFSDIRRALNTPDQPYKLYMANRLFGEKSYSFLEDYLNKTDEHYGIRLEPVDFIHDSSGATSLINAWVADNTAKKITEIIPAGTLDHLTRLVLVNAVYFKGDWAKKFDPTLTKEQDFHVSCSETVRVQMMHMPKVKLVYGSNHELNAQAIELPYAGDRLSMIIVLPDPSRTIRDLEMAMSADDVINIGDKFRMVQREVHVWLPRFHLDEKDDLSALLTELGMVDAFKNADFSGMDGTKNLVISKVLHRAVVDVNEEGTEAAAATAVVMMLRCAMPKDPFEFRADRPFLFFIRDNETNTVIFFGRVAKPGAVA